MNKICKHKRCKKSCHSDNHYCIFHCKKDDWFYIKEESNTEEEQKIWTEEELIEQFWRELREEKIEKKDTFFDGFIFPGDVDFLERFGTVEDIENKVLSSDFVFTESVFLGRINASSLTFIGDLFFHNTEIKEDGDFHSSVFVKEVVFSSYPSPLSTLPQIHQLIFSYSRFKENIKLYVKVQSKTLFNFATIEKGLTISHSNFINRKESHISLFGVRFTDTSELFLRDISGDNFSFTLPSYFPKNTVIAKCDFRKTKFTGSNIYTVDFEDCIFLNEKKELYDEVKSQEENDDSPSLKEVERSYYNLFKNFSSKNEIAIANDFLKGKIRVGEKRIDLEDKEEKEKLEQKRFLYSETKKHFDELTLYDKGDEYFIKEMDIKRKIEPLPDKFYIYPFSWISRYNTSPVKAFCSLVIISLVFTLIYDCLELTGSIHFSLTSSVPLFKTSQELNDLNNLQISAHYLQVIISTAIWALLILSIRRKFKRN